MVTTESNQSASPAGARTSMTLNTFEHSRESMVVPDLYHCAENNTTVRLMSETYGVTLNSRRVACPLDRFLEGEDRWGAPGHPKLFFLKFGEEPSHKVLSPVWCYG
ncbi:hypothetical protein TNCV_2323621 [Trichonephila clavipes]|nr:hypothetical protein TNCV_2323621 [Trichonephila clavipes]